jgi:uncharacterized Zn finger protein
VTCSKCSAENAAGAKFCIECGDALKSRCPKCGSVNPSKAKFRQECGTSFGSVTAPATPISEDNTAIKLNAAEVIGEIPQGERKIVTALLADISD